MRSFLPALAGACLLACGATAQAGAYSDDMTKCLVAHTSQADKAVYVQWVFAAIALHPEVKAMANISDQQRAMLNARTGALFVRLLTKDCRTESLAALAFENDAALDQAFSKFGEQAMEGLLNHPAVEKGMEGITAAIDTPEMRDFLREVENGKDLAK